MSWDYSEPVDMEEVQELLARTGAVENFQTPGVCMCDDTPHLNALHDLAGDVVPLLIKELKEWRKKLPGLDILEGLD